MALVKSYSLQGGVEVPQSYWLVDRPHPSKLQGSLSFHMIGFATKAKRNAHKAAMTAFTQKAIACGVAGAALEAKKPQPGDTPEQIAQKEADSIPLRAAFSAAVAELKAAEAVVSDPAIQPMAAQHFPVPFERISECQTGDDPDKAKIYTFVKTLPDWGNTQDDV